MERTRVFRITIADRPVEAFSVGQSAGAMMSHRGCKHLFGTAPGIHGDVPNPGGLTSVARPITPEAQIDLTGASVDPDRLIAGQRARRPIRRITCDVRGGMKNQRATIIGWRQSCLIPHNVAAVVMPSRLMSTSPSTAAAERNNGRERNDGSHQHVSLSFIFSSAFDRECGRHLAGKPSLPHPTIGRLDISGAFR